MPLDAKKTNDLYFSVRQLDSVYASNPLKFIQDLKTFDPRTRDRDLPFILYPYQIKYAEELIKAIETGEEMFVEKSRDMGVSWVTLAVILWAWAYKPGFQALIGSRKEDYVDNWQMDSLFGKLDYFITNFPNEILGWNQRKHRNFMKLIHPTNGSVILGESANINFARAGRYNIVFMDELAFWPFQQGSWEAAGESTPTRLAVTTPSDKPSYAKALRNSGLVPLKTLHWTLHPLKDQEWYEKQKKRKTTDEIARELDINWEGSTKGIVYPEIMHANVGTFPYINNTTLYVTWDFGLDGLALQWWQKNVQNGRWRLIDCFVCQNEIIDYVFPAFGKPIDSKFNYDLEDIEFFEQISQLPQGVHYGDPDVAKRDLKTGTSTRQHLTSHLNIYVQSNPAANSFPVRRTETKRLLQNGIEVNETPRTMFYLECMRNARYPQRLETSQATTEITLPIHDFTSHHRTATEYLAVNVGETAQAKGTVSTYGEGAAITARPQADPKTYDTTIPPTGRVTTQDSWA